MSAQQTDLFGAGCSYCAHGWLDLSPGQLCPSCGVPLIDSWTAYAEFMNRENQISVAGFDVQASSHVERRNPRRTLLGRFLHSFSSGVKRWSRG